MGYPMALNLRKKLPESAKLIISELNQETVQRFLDETKDMGFVDVASTPREVSAKSVWFQVQRSRIFSSLCFLDRTSSSPCYLQVLMFGKFSLTRQTVS